MYSNSIAKVRKWDETYFKYFLPDDQVIRIVLTFVNGGSMTNANVFQGFHDEKKVEDH